MAVAGGRVVPPAAGPVDVCARARPVEHGRLVVHGGADGGLLVPVGQREEETIERERGVKSLKELQGATGCYRRTPAAEAGVRQPR